MKRKKLPIGHSDFKRVIEEDFYYVDKSLLIKELIDSGALITILPRPRRFGKTLNLFMLKYFFEKTGDQRENLFKSLAIEASGAEYKAHQGRYPVIFLSFKDVKSSTWESCMEDLRNVIRKIVSAHSYLVKEDALLRWEKENLENLLAYNNTGDYKNSLYFLSSCLYKVHKEKVVILIDEYDVPIQQGYTGGFYEQSVEFIKTFLSGALKDNPSLERAVLTGILRVSKESIFSDLNNPDVCTLLSHSYADKFGLLEEEVRQLLEYFGIGPEMDHVRSWYNGYICGETELYNPWSIINYAAKWRDGFKSYWINSSSNTLIKLLIKRAGQKVKDNLKSLMEDKPITKRISEHVIFPEIESDSDHLFSFLLFSGYLKPVKEIHRGNKTFYDLLIPNQEVKLLYDNIITSWFSETIDNDKMDLMLLALTSGDIDTFAEVFTYYLETSISYFNLGENDAERVYQAFTLGLLVYLAGEYTVTSEEPAGYGRADLMLIPHDKTKRGVIFEFKKASKVKKQTLEKAAEAAKKQMIDKHYRSRMEAHGVSLITQLAIGFKGKECLILEVDG